MTCCSACSAPVPEGAASCNGCGAAWTVALPPGERASATAFPPRELPAGMRIGDRYELVSLLGKGGMGLVYKARDHELADDIAIKVLQSPCTQDPKDAERLKREIITARKVTHPNVLRIHDFGLSGDEGFVSMELLEGGSVADRIREGRWTIDERIDVAIGICEGLAAAHAQGIVHRDIKPHNVLFDRAGVPKLVDFGLAHVSAATTLNAGFSGTPHYMSPEVADGREIDARSDVYSLGVLLFQTFTGELPFQADGMVRLAMLHANEPPPRPSSLEPKLPRGLEAVILKALEKDPARRYPDASQIADDLRSVKAGLEPPHAVVEAHEPISPPPTDLSLKVPPRPPEPRARRVPLVAGLAGIGVLLAGTLFAVGTALPAGPAVDPAPTPPALAAATSTPTPAPAPTLVAMNLPPPQLQVKARPWVTVSIDGEVVAKETPCRLVVKPGRHTLTLANDDQTFRYEKEIVAVGGQTTWVSADVPARKVSLGATVRAAATPTPTAP